MKRILYCFILCLAACSGNTIIQKNKVEKRDSLMARFLGADTIPGLVDSQDYHFKMFLAYYRNDTIHMAQWLKDGAKSMPQKMNLHQSYSDSIASLVATKNDDLFDEAYQMDYGNAFCEDALSIFIHIKWNPVNDRYDSASMITVVVPKTFISKTGHDQRGIKCISKKNLSPAQWNILKGDIYYCDFWGMQSENHESGLDGSGLFVFGKKRRTAGVDIFDKKYIYRWAAESTALGKLLKDAYKISGAKIKCN